MIEAFLLGLLAQSSLILMALIVHRVKIATGVVGAFAAFGAGSLLGAISFSLIPQAEAAGAPQITICLLIGALVYIVSDRVVERRFAGAGPVALRSS